jgi:hypothetical protein
MVARHPHKVEARFESLFRVLVWLTIFGMMEYDYLRLLCGTDDYRYHQTNIPIANNLTTLH